VRCVVRRLSIAQRRDANRVRGNVGESKGSGRGESGKQLEGQGGVAHPICAPTCWADEPEVRGTGAPQTPGELSGFISSLFTGIFRAVPILDLFEQGVQHHNGALRFAEHEHRAVIAENREIKRQRHGRQLEEHALARVATFVDRFHVCGDLRQVFRVVAATAMFPRQKAPPNQ
jgi:hypothetical protein